jgi:hypothetical protein
MIVAFGPVVAVCLLLDPIFAGSNPAEDDGFLMAIQIRSRTSFGGEVKPSDPCHEILRNVKKPYECEQRCFIG